jgi:hypothetical protein
MAVASQSYAQVAPAAGVVIDADGVLSVKQYQDPNGALSKERIKSAKQSLDSKVYAASKLRKISLNRLEAAIVAKQGVPNDEMKYLAGLQRVEYVFYYPESKDIVIAGPAEGWYTDPSSRVVGVGNGRPVVQLQDLIAGLRAFPPNGKPTGLIGCSIDPTPESQQALSAFLDSVPKKIMPGSDQPIIDGIMANMGMHAVTINGVSPKSHFAQVLVEADYRMKLIAIGKEDPPMKMATYISKAKPSDLGVGGLARWYFVPDYQCVSVSEDKNAMKIVGNGVKLIGEQEHISSDGTRQVVGSASKASEAFTTAFTKLYPELAARSPIYAELRNMIDIAVAAAFIQQQNYYAQSGWNMDFFGDEKAYGIEKYSVPKTVEAAMNVVRKSGHLMTPIAGGVEIQASKAVERDKILPDEKGAIDKLHQEIKPNLADGQWWWD